MRSSVRLRALVAVAVFAPLAYFYLAWTSYTVMNIARYYHNGSTQCDGSWKSSLNGCYSYSIAAAWLELIAFTAVAAGLAVLLAHWVAAPLEDMTRLIGKFGPTSLGLRLTSHGPQDESRQLSDEINAMLDRLAEGYEAQRRFASNASHELRTPLATQRALIEVSLGSALTEDQLQLVARQLLATNERNERIIDGLLVLAETERGLTSRATLALDRLVADACAALAPSATDAGLKFTTEVTATTISGEQPLIERLIANLLTNAIKYNDPGGSVHVTVSPTDGLIVTNTGPMVRPEQVGGLFEPFHRLRGERLDHGGGAGLGLTIARSIVAAHGGSIQANANTSGGLTVQVRLP